MVKRIVRFDGEHGPKAYELAYEAISTFRAQTKSLEAAAWDAFEKLRRIGEFKEMLGDLALMRLGKVKKLELLESERDVIVKALEEVKLPTFALGNKQRALEILNNAQAVLVEDVEEGPKAKAPKAIRQVS